MASAHKSSDQFFACHSHQPRDIKRDFLRLLHMQIECGKGVQRKHLGEMGFKFGFRRMRKQIRFYFWASGVSTEWPGHPIAGCLRQQVASASGGESRGEGSDGESRSQSKRQGERERVRETERRAALGEDMKN